MQLHICTIYDISPVEQLLPPLPCLAGSSSLDAGPPLPLPPCRKCRSSPQPYHWQSGSSSLLQCVSESALLWPA